MPVHFSEEEFQRRQAAVQERMGELGLDAILLFNQQSKYYLTGYDSFGFVLFECLVFRADGTCILLTRPTDVPAARHTSTIRDICVWRDGRGEHPAGMLKSLLGDLGLAGKRIGVEYNTWGLTGSNALAVQAALSYFCELQDCSNLVTGIRLVKSDEELNYVRQAGELADRALERAQELAAAGMFEGQILAEMQGEVLRAGGDYSGNEFTIGSGAGALLPRYHSGRRHLNASDQLVVQIGGAYRRYHAALMSTILVGQVSARQQQMFEAMSEALAKAHAAMRPGADLRDIFAIYQDCSKKHGMGEYMLSSCGYSLGAAYHPTWMDWPWIHPVSNVKLAPRMVFYIHMVLGDQDRGLAMSLGDTVVVTEGQCERLSKLPVRLVSK